MSANTATLPSWHPRTLTDSRTEITTMSNHRPNIACLASRELVHQLSGVIDLTVTEGGQVIRSIKFSVVAAPTPIWLLRAVEQAGALLLLPFDWDRQGAPLIEPRAIQTALDALCMLMDQDSSLPAWTPTREGGVQLDWHENGIDLEIEFGPTSTDGYAVLSDRAGHIPEWDGTVNANQDTLQRVFRERLR